jgi:hypothetical protein
VRNGGGQRIRKNWKSSDGRVKEVKKELSPKKNAHAGRAETRKHESIRNFVRTCDEM